ncbi:MAG: TonB C-terminal domain-containing protein [Desulfobacula sp.]|jgi:colicin import membrane protein|nr:TonB C-terminal domain-containing protein [Desulfobacula sp.]
MSSPENFKNKRQVLYSHFDNNRKTGVVFFSISLIVHALFFYGMIFFQKFRLPKPMLPVIQVDLVSFSEEPVTREAPGKKEIPEAVYREEGIPVTPVQPQPPPKIKKIPIIKPDISLKTKPKNLKDLIAQQEKKKKESDKKKEKKPIVKPKPIDPDKTLEKEKENLEKKIENQNKNAIAEALSRLEKKVQGQGEKKQGEKTQTSSFGTGKKGYTPIDLYKMVLGSEIEQNWVFNDSLARLDQNLEVRILIKILKSGEIRDIIYETRSGNHYLDESAKKAIKKTNPLPPLPPGMPSYDVVVIFTPKGLK